MGEHTCIGFIHSSDLDAIEHGLTALYQQEGYHRIPKPPLHIRKSYAYYKSHWRFSNQLLLDSLRAAALYPGAPGWTMVKVDPEEFLCSPTTGAERPRLADLTVAVGCDGFHLNMYDGDSLVLIESNAQGEIAFSGGGGSSPEKFAQYISKEHQQERFRLIEIPEMVQAILEDREADILDQVDGISALLCGDNFNHNYDYAAALLYPQLGVEVPFPEYHIEVPMASAGDMRPLYFQRDIGPQIE